MAVLQTVVPEGMAADSDEGSPRSVTDSEEERQRDLDNFYELVHKNGVHFPQLVPDLFELVSRSRLRRTGARFDPQIGFS